MQKRNFSVERVTWGEVRAPIGTVDYVDCVGFAL